MPNTPDFPAEFPADPAGATDALRWTIKVLLMTTLALAALNADALANWVRELPASPNTAKAMTFADGWNARSAELGLDAPRSKLHGAWKQLEAMGWSDAAGRSSSTHDTRSRDPKPGRS